jgi:hypothetical protein
MIPAARLGVLPAADFTDGPRYERRQPIDEVRLKPLFDFPAKRTG